MYNELHCILCGDVGKLAVMGRKGIDSIFRCARNRGDGKLEEELQSGNRICIHEKCRRNYLIDKNAGAVALSTSVPNGDIASVSDISAVENTEGSSGFPAEDCKDEKLVELKPFSWQTHCFVCEQPLIAKDRKGILKRVSCTSGKKNSIGLTLQEVLLSQCETI